jgi:hypothetical protein
MCVSFLIPVVLAYLMQHDAERGSRHGYRPPITDYLWMLVLTPLIFGGLISLRVFFTWNRRQMSKR